ncbi:hypothetical protein [Saccharothrix deserti]|uniref:hypothetical protein n=1 Tax=Saccharothrix deserti TaxID=2593674 RepID=UPI001EE3D310|nr:hypothetical protein [Saccharothrix deserti]
MSGDFSFSEQDRGGSDRGGLDSGGLDSRGLADWLEACDVPDQRGGPAYVVSFGWLPSRLPPAPLIPAPRQAGDDLLRDDLR